MNNHYTPSGDSSTSKNTEAAKSSLVASEGERRHSSGRELSDLMQATAALLRQVDNQHYTETIEPLKLHLRLWIALSVIAFMVAAAGWWLYSNNSTRFGLLIESEQAKATALVKENTALQSQLESRQRENTNLLIQYNLLREQRVRDQSLLEHSRTQRMALEREQLNLKGRLSDARSKMARIESELSEQSTEQIQLNFQLASMTKSHARTTEEANKSALKIDHFQSLLNQTLEKNRNLEAQLEWITQNKVETESRLRASEDAINSERSDHQQTQTERNNLRSTLAGLNQQLRAANSEKERLQERLNEAEITQKLAEQERADTLTQLRVTATERARLEGQLELTERNNRSENNTQANSMPNEPTSYSLGVFYRDSGDYKAAAEQFAKTLDHTPKHYKSMMNLAQQYYLGRGIKHDPQAAFALYKQVADESDDTYTPDAQYIVGIYYLRGTGTRLSEVRGRKYLEKAANNGSERARIALEALASDEQ